MDGIILVDKPRGMTSGECTRQVAGRLGAAKAGHAGSLDANATGLLLIALGSARKSISYFMGLDKEYVALLRLHGDIKRRDAIPALMKFTGKIIQVPPRRSRVARRPRERAIYSIRLLSLEGRDMSIRVSCEAGTYMRKLATDLGAGLGCGAHLVGLRRTRAGPFTESDCVDIGEVSEGKVLTLKGALAMLNKDK
ncbi:MAG: hypothetical protein HY367_03365 [Candidatus Aenigmarchaeota archaeon]|nr:hypothetical protein [Candidatus Aenigmarchaeota archaeon]